MKLEFSLAKVTCAAVVALSMGASVASAATIFDTTGGWDGSNSIGPFGVPNTQTYGQTFNAPSDNVLDSFTFFLSGSASLQFQAEVYKWNGSRADGAALFTSAPITFGDTGGVMAPVFVNTGGISLTAGDTYVALLTVSGPDPSNAANSTGTDAFGFLAGTNNAGDGGGAFVFFNNSDYADINSVNWDNFLGNFGDAAWIANFSAGMDVPEPASLVLLGAGLFGLGALRRRAK